MRYEVLCYNSGQKKFVSFSYEMMDEDDSKAQEIFKEDLVGKKGLCGSFMLVKVTPKGERFILAFYLPFLNLLVS